MGGMVVVGVDAVVGGSGDIVAGAEGVVRIVRAVVVEVGAEVDAVGVGVAGWLRCLTEDKNGVGAGLVDSVAVAVAGHDAGTAAGVVVDGGVVRGAGRSGLFFVGDVGRLLLVRGAAAEFGGDGAAFARDAAVVQLFLTGIADPSGRRCQQGCGR